MGVHQKNSFFWIIIIISVLVLAGCFPQNPPTYQLTLEANPAQGGDVDGEGKYKGGATVALTATPSQDWVFNNWTRNGVVVSNNAAFDYIMPAYEHTLMANFTPIPDTFTLTLESSPTAAGAVAGGGEFAEGDTVTVIATPVADWGFVNWTKDGVQVSEDRIYGYTMPATDTTLIANFVELPKYTLSIIASPTEAGTVTGMGDYTEDATVTVTATPNQYWAFVNWTKNGVQVSIDSNFVYTIPATSATLTANFEWDANVSLKSLVEDTQFEMYDATDFGRWQVYIFPVLIEAIPDIGTYQLNIGTDQYPFERKGGDVYATVPEYEHDEQDIKDNGVIVAY